VVGGKSRGCVLERDIRVIDGWLSEISGWFGVGRISASFCRWRNCRYYGGGIFCRFEIGGTAGGGKGEIL